MTGPQQTIGRQICRQFKTLHSKIQTQYLHKVMRYSILSTGLFYIAMVCHGSEDRWVHPLNQPPLKPKRGDYNAPPLKFASKSPRHNPLPKSFNPLSAFICTTALEADFLNVYTFNHNLHTIYLLYRISF